MREESSKNLPSLGDFRFLVGDGDFLDGSPDWEIICWSS